MTGYTMANGDNEEIKFTRGDSDTLVRLELAVTGLQNRVAMGLKFIMTASTSVTVMALVALFKMIGDMLK
jgi:hypothetical protein